MKCYCYRKPSLACLSEAGSSVIRVTLMSITSTTRSFAALKAEQARLLALTAVGRKRLALPGK